MMRQNEGEYRLDTGGNDLYCSVPGAGSLDNRAFLVGILGELGREPSL